MNNTQSNEQNNTDSSLTIESVFDTQGRDYLIKTFGWDDTATDEELKEELRNRFNACGIFEDKEKILVHLSVK